MPKKSMMTPRVRKEVDTSTFEGKFGARLRMLREKAKMSVEELSDVTGIPNPTLYRWESGDRCPINPQVFLVTEALKIKISRLLDGLDK